MPPTNYSAPEAQDQEQMTESRRLRFRIACRMLRLSGKIDAQLPGQRMGESQIDFFVRLGIASDKYTAAEALIAAKNLTHVLDEVIPLL